MYQSDVCLCGDHSSCSVTGVCQAVCSGDSSQICGDFDNYGTVHSTPLIVISLQIQHPGQALLKILQIIPFICDPFNYILN